MHLHLSSYRLGERASDLRSLSVSRKAVVIANALDFSEDQQRKDNNVAREISEIGGLGFESTELDLRAFFSDPEALSERLEGIGFIWAMGGNTFLLRRAFKQSGLDRYLRDHRDDDSMIYGGYSAGAIVVTPTLSGIDIVDPPETVVPGYNAEVIWDGLAFVPYCLAPHYKSDHPDSPGIDLVIEYYIEHRMPFIALRDGEAISAKA